jgi:hypothetical protein
MEALRQILHIVFYLAKSVNKHVITARVSCIFNLFNATKSLFVFEQFLHGKIWEMFRFRETSQLSLKFRNWKFKLKVNDITFNCWFWGEISVIFARTFYNLHIIRLLSIKKIVDTNFTKIRQFSNSRNSHHMFVTLEQLPSMFTPPLPPLYILYLVNLDRSDDKLIDLLSVGPYNWRLCVM